jgi:[ribosomal protein S5]-alanine N-acetyltransferase
LNSSEIRIPVTGGIYLSPVAPSDQAALIEYLSSKDVYNTTLNIPHPYSAAHADHWIQKRIQHTQTFGREVTFAIRNPEGKLIGVVSCDSLEPGLTHKAELGYWIAKPYWGKGIVTDSVKAFVKYAFDELGLCRITASVFEPNLASARVLEKNGFQLEGHLRKHYQKDGRFMDARIYGLLKTDLT